MKKIAIGVSILSLLLIVFATSSCKKDHEHTSPVITIESPTDGENVALSDSVHIEGIITDDEELHEMSVIVKSHMGDTVFSAYPHVHALKTYTFHYHYAPAMEGMYHLHVNASDHDGMVTTKEVIFNVIP